MNRNLLKSVVFEEALSGKNDVCTGVYGFNCNRKDVSFATGNHRSLLISISQPPA